MAIRNDTKKTRTALTPMVTVAHAHAISSSGIGGASVGELASARGDVGIGGGTASTFRQNIARSKDGRAGLPATCTSTRADTKRSGPPARAIPHHGQADAPTAANV